MADLMKQARELRPCPFCGGEAERIDFGPGAGENEGGSCIACRRCQASGPVEFGFKESFVANWNRRAALSAAPEGFVMVPVEPTPEMLCAGERAHWQKQSDMLSPAPTEFYEACGGPMGYAYLAMLAARPQGVKDGR